MAAYPHLRTLTGPLDPNIRNSARMAGIRDHAVELAKAEITDELKNLESDDLDPNGPERKQAKD